MNNSKNLTIHVLFDGYSNINASGTAMKANCTCTLIKGPRNMIVDTMTAWDSDKILEALKHHNIAPKDINYVVSTHGHSDHIGNNNLFLGAKHFVGFSVSHRDTYYEHPFKDGTPYRVTEGIEIIPTPGHTLQDVTVIVKTEENVTYAITGDLFEHGDDINKPSLWLDAGSESPELQRTNRLRIAQISDWIIPGHGPMFKCTEEIRKTLQSQIQ